MAEPKLSAHVSMDGSTIRLQMIDANGQAVEVDIGPEWVDKFVIALVQCSAVAHERLREQAHEIARQHNTNINQGH